MGVQRPTHLGWQPTYTVQKIPGISLCMRELSETCCHVSRPLGLFSCLCSILFCVYFESFTVVSIFYCCARTATLYHIFLFGKNYLLRQLHVFQFIRKKTLIIPPQCQQTGVVTRPTLYGKLQMYFWAAYMSPVLSPVLAACCWLQVY